jgi:hypothetical protein
VDLELKPGSRFRSAVCSTEVAVVKAPKEPVDLRIGGHPVVPIGEQPAGDAAVEPAFAGGTAVGKRYTDAEGSIEILCTKAGEGALSIADQALVLKEAKPLPASD